MKSAILIVLMFALMNKSSQSPIDSQQQNEVNKVDISMKFSCALNSSCVESVSNRVVRALKSRSAVDFGIFTIEPVKNGLKSEEGRSMSKVWDFVNGNSIRVPFGKFSFNLQRSNEHENSLEFFIGQKVEGKKSDLTSKKFSKL
jgi:hypothetical protein